jgi:hypothetical protein
VRASAVDKKKPKSGNPKPETRNAQQGASEGKVLAAAKKPADFLDVFRVKKVTAIIRLNSKVCPNPKP